MKKDITFNSNFWDARPCLVTGGAGFGGAHLCEQLLKRRAKVYIYDQWFPSNSYLRFAGLSDRVNFIQGDIRNLQFLKLIMERFEINTVFHLAAQPIVPLSNVMPLETLEINAQGTFVVLEATREAGSVRRLVFASSGAYYGTTTTNRAITEEESPLPASNVYASSKVAGDIAVRTWARIYDVKMAACRFMNTYGPGDTNFSRIIPRAIKNLICGSPYEFGGRDDGTTRLDYLNIRDMSNAYIMTAEQLDDISGEAFNFGGGNPVSTRELTNKISLCFDGNEREPLFEGPAKVSPVIKFLDIKKARQYVGWEPSTSLETGLIETIEWYRKFWDAL